MTMSPIYGDRFCDLLPVRWPVGGSRTENESTLVGASFPRQSRLSARIDESLPSTIASSMGEVEIAFAAAKTALFTRVLAVECFRHRAERTTISSWILDFS